MRLRGPIPLSELTELVPEPARQIPPFPELNKLNIFVASLDSPRFSAEDSLTFIRKDAPASLFTRVKAACIISEEPLKNTLCPNVQSDSIYETICILIHSLSGMVVRDEDPFCRGKVHPSAVVEGSVEEGAVVGAGSFIGRGSVIGSDSVIGPNVTVLENCRIGKRCRIQSGTVIGSAGFGFYQYAGQCKHIPHPAGVDIGDRVMIGANSVVAAGVLNPTIIENDCKLDSHIQIAHNVILGAGAMIASQSGIAGSTEVGAGLRMGGASSIDGHLVLGKNVTIAARSGVTKNTGDNSIIAGYPAQPFAVWKKQKIYLKNQVK